MEIERNTYDEVNLFVKSIDFHSHFVHIQDLNERSRTWMSDELNAREKIQNAGLKDWIFINRKEWQNCPLAQSIRRILRMSQESGCNEAAPIDHRFAYFVQMTNRLFAVAHNLIACARVYQQNRRNANIVRGSSITVGQTGPVGQKCHVQVIVLACCTV